MLELQNKTLQRIFNWGLLIVAGILLVSFTYMDILWTTRHGMNFWTFLFNGRILHFFEDNYVPSGNLYQATEPCAAIYNFLIYLIFAIWDLPLWILEKFAGVDVMNNFACLIYMKLLPVGATLFCAKIIGKILKETGAPRERIKLTQYLYLSSTVILANVLIASRYDSLCSVFLLLSSLYYLRKEFGKFIIFAGVAFCFNYLAFSMFVPLLLLREKNFRKIAKYFLCMLAPYILTNVPFMVAKSAIGTGKITIFNYFSTLFSKTNGLFSYFTVFYAILVVFCFLADKEKSEDKSLILWVSFVSITSVFAFCFTLPYWPIIFVPFMELAIGFSDPKKSFLFIMLEFIGMAGAVCEKMLLYWWCYVGDVFKSMMMSYIVPDRVYNYDSVILGLWRKLPDTLIAKNSVPAFFYSFFVAGFLILAFLCFPKIDKLLQKSDFCSTENKLSDVLLVRFIVMLGICFLPFINLIK